jgi:hypothetical protein
VRGTTIPGTGKQAANLGTTRVIHPDQIARVYRAIGGRFETRREVRVMGPGPGFTRDSDPIARVRKCGFTRISTNVSVEQEDATGRARYGGLMVCGSIHCCPVCSANIRHRRMLDIEAAALRWLADGGSLVMVTLTTRHFMGMPLDALWSMLSKAWNATTSGRRGKADRERWGMLGYIRATEVTHGANGWHPHLHLLLFVQGDAEQIASEVEATWGQRWRGYITGRGWPAPSIERGVRVSPVTGSTVGQYLAKCQDGLGGDWSPALELARGDLKTSRGESVTPFGLLERIGSGCHQSLAVWREWEQASKGKKAIQWSRGLREALGVEDVDDQSAAERNEYVASLLYLMVPEEWEAVRMADGSDFELLMRAEQDGVQGVREFIAELLGIDPDDLDCERCTYTREGFRTRACDQCKQRMMATSTEVQSW